MGNEVADLRNGGSWSRVGNWSVEWGEEKTKFRGGGPEEFKEIEGGELGLWREEVVVDWEDVELNV